MDCVLITGASSGIGYEMSKILAKKASNLILVAREKNKLQQTAKDLQDKFSIEAKTIQQDLSKPEAAQKIFNQVKECQLTVTTLINNAGFYIQGAFSDTLWKEEEELIYLQCLTQTKLTKLFLPEMMKNNKGRILNVCSTGSFMSGPYNSIYCATKSFLLSFSEALSEELSNTGITVTALCPGGTNTPFQDSDRRKGGFLNPVMEASDVAAIGYKALMKGKRIVVPGLFNKIQVFALRFLPRSYVAKIAGKFILGSSKQNNL